MNELRLELNKDSLKIHNNPRLCACLTFLDFRASHQCLVQLNMIPKCMQSIIKTKNRAAVAHDLQGTNSFVVDKKHENQHMSLHFNTKTREKR